MSNLSEEKKEIFKSLEKRAKDAKSIEDKIFIGIEIAKFYLKENKINSQPNSFHNKLNTLELDEFIFLSNKKFLGYLYSKNPNFVSKILSTSCYEENFTPKIASVQIDLLEEIFLHGNITDFTKLFEIFKTHYENQFEKNIAFREEKLLEKFLKLLILTGFEKYIASTHKLFNKHTLNKNLYIFLLAKSNALISCGKNKEAVDCMRELIPFINKDPYLLRETAVRFKKLNQIENVESYLKFSILFSKNNKDYDNYNLSLAELLLWSGNINVLEKENLSLDFGISKLETFFHVANALHNLGEKNTYFKFIDQSLVEIENTIQNYKEMYFESDISFDYYGSVSKAKSLSSVVISSLLENGYIKQGLELYAENPDLMIKINISSNSIWNFLDYIYTNLNLPVNLYFVSIFTLLDYPEKFVEYLSFTIIQTRSNSKILTDCFILYGIYLKLTDESPSVLEKINSIIPYSDPGDSINTDSNDIFFNDLTSPNDKNSRSDHLTAERISEILGGELP
ncbi:MAG: hypothetical protein SH817_02050 [Leptospira sp.]|nr:hypothetical protein [Leptospira sp.]